MWLMRFTASLIFTALTLAPVAAQEHIEYPWCAVYGDDFGSSNCGFSTIEQCRATVSGIGGFCELNPFYKPRQPVKRHKSQRRQSDYPRYYDHSSGSWPSYFHGN